MIFIFKIVILILDYHWIVVDNTMDVVYCAGTACPSEKPEFTILVFMEFVLSLWLFFPRFVPWIFDFLTSPPVFSFTFKELTI